MTTFTAHRAFSTALNLPFHPPGIRYHVFPCIDFVNLHRRFSRPRTGLDNVATLPDATYILTDCTPFFFLPRARIFKETQSRGNYDRIGMEQSHKFVANFFGSALPVIYYSVDKHIWKFRAA